MKSDGLPSTPRNPDPQDSESLRAGRAAGTSTTLEALQAIVFDFDGVIVDTERLHLLAYQDTLAPKGITMSADDYFARYLGYDDAGVFKAIGTKNHYLHFEKGLLQVYLFGLR